MFTILLATIALLFSMAAPASAGSPAAPTTQPATLPAVRFTALDIYIDCGSQPLAAYQLEFNSDPAAVAIVGIEGGDHPAFRDAPYYDPAALFHHRVIIAAFNTGRDLPTGKTRVARLHLRLVGPTEPENRIKLDVAASADGKPIAAAVSIGQGEHP